MELALKSCGVAKATIFEHHELIIKPVLYDDSKTFFSFMITVRLL